MAARELLQQVQAADLLRFTTAGSVDDGKSTLIGRLLHDSKGIYEDQLAAVTEASHRNGQEGVDLALLTDGLKAEREQRITIDVAYRHFSTPRRRFIIADTPGHEQYTRNMATGASTADLAIILIDAAQGVVTQSRRHGFIATLLGIRHLVIAVNKMDLVGFSEEVFQAIRAEYTEYAKGLPDAELTFIPISALLGDNVVDASSSTPWYSGPVLLEFLETVQIAATDPTDPFRFPVQHVLRPDGAFRGYCGTVASGSVAVGDALTVLPSGRKSRVSRIVGPKGEAERARAREAVVVCLEDDIDVSRGDMLTPPEALPALTRDFDAVLIWMDQQALQPGQTLIVKHTTNMARGQVVEVRHRTNPNTLVTEAASSLALNEIGHVHMRLFRPLMCDPYDVNRQTGSFILIDPVTNATLAGGLITEARGLESLSLEATPKSGNLTRQTGRVTAGERAMLLRQQPVTLWLTGLSGAGKSTVAYALEERLILAGHACAVLDGDNIRGRLNRDLGFSPGDRKENIRRVAEVARLLNEAGLIVISSFISPYEADREMARDIIGEAAFVETLVDAPLDECERRDPKGLYSKARAGEIGDFTGVSAPYERPLSPGLRLDSNHMPVGELVQKCLDFLSKRGVCS